MALARRKGAGMKILVLNSGSGSQTCSLFDLAAAPDQLQSPREPIWEARVETTSLDGKAIRRDLTISREGKEIEQRSLDTGRPMTEVLRSLLQDSCGDDKPIRGPEEVNAVGHRVVHGGRDFRGATLIDGHVENKIHELAAFAPLHNPSNLEGFRIARELFPDARQIAVFDTSFHQSLSDAASIYPGPLQWQDQGIRRYGFHGTSFRWAMGRAAQLLGKPADQLRLIVCHLGGGCSLGAIKNGKSVDTTMGFTPLDGIAMSTRSGGLDPGILLYLLRQGMGVDDLEATLNKRSGLAGLSGLPGDTRIIETEIAKGNTRAGLARAVFVHRLCAGIGQMIAGLAEKPDAIIFTDVIGLDDPEIRRLACEPFRFLGADLDPALNAASPVDTDVSTAESEVRILVIKAREAWQIALDCLAIEPIQP